MTEQPAGPRFRRSPAGAVALTVVAAGLGGWGVVNSPLFDTQSIVVHGIRHLAPAEVIEATGVRSGDNLVRLSMDAVAGRVERLPWVADAAAERDLPSTLVVRVVERSPVGWFSVEGSYLLVARDATILDRGPGPPRWLPMLGQWSAPLDPGQAISTSPATLRVAASMDGGLLREISAAISVGDDVALELRRGGTVQYGEPVWMARKNEELSGLLRWATLNQVEIQAIDLRDPRAPTVEPLGEPVAQ